MNRASPAELRKSMRVVETLVKAGINFVPLPVLNAAHHKQLLIQLNKIIEELGE